MHFLDRQGQKFSGIDEGHQKVPSCVSREKLYLKLPYLRVCEGYLLEDPHLFKISPKMDSNCPRTWNYTQNVPPGVKCFLSWWLVLVGMGFPKLIKIFSRFKYYAHMKFLSISPQLNFSRYSTANFKVIGPACRGALHSSSLGASNDVSTSILGHIFSDLGSSKGRKSCKIVKISTGLGHQN